MPIRAVATAAIALLLAAAGGATAQDRPALSDVWKIDLNQPVAAIPPTFAEFACGSDGGPPKLQLAGFEGFRSCAAEPSGLHEVYFRYDDELEYWAKANNNPLIAAAGGTKVYDLPVIMSVLIDDAGIVKGVRLVSDPRDTSIRREEARFLQPFLLARFLRPGTDWTCTDLPPENGETPVNGEFVKQDCTLAVDGIGYQLSARYLRGAGERQRDPHTGKFTEGQFTSHVRFEMHAL